MPASYHQLYVHCVWATFSRQPWLTPEIMDAVLRCSTRKLSDLDCAPLALGGYRDHIHALLRLRPAMPVSRLMNEVKGSSSHFINHCFSPEPRFCWQTGYGVFSISKRSIPDVASYVLSQEAHHSDGKLFDELEACGDEQEAGPEENNPGR